MDRLEDKLSSIRTKIPTDIGSHASLADEEHKARIESFRQNTSERKSYATKTFTFICRYMIFVGLVILLNGFHLFGFYMSDMLMSILLTTTTANVLIVFHFVMKYLFNANHKKRR